MKIVNAVAALLVLLSFSSCSSAGDIEASLSKARQEGKVVMLELGSIGCIPCDQMQPVMQQLRDTYRGKLEVIFIDVRQDNRTGRRFRVTMIPTQVFLDKDGKEMHRHVGFYAYEEIAQVLKKAGL